MSVSKFIGATLCIVLTGLVTDGTTYTTYFHVLPRAPREIEVEWDSFYKDPPYPVWRLVVNDKIYPDSEMKVCEWCSYWTFLEGYLPNTRHRVQLAMCNFSETNPKNCMNVLEERTVFLPPEAPKNFSAVAVDNQSIQFGWEIPTQPLTGVSVRLLVWNDSITHTSEIYPVEPVMTGIVSGLQPLTEYNTSLSVHNLGQSVNDTCRQTKIVLTAPNEPHIKVTHVGDDFVGVSFEFLPNGRFFNVSFTAVATSSYGDKHVCNTTAGNVEVSCTIEGLESLRLYNITATACVNGLCSASTPAIQVKTSGVDIPGEILTTSTTPPNVSDNLTGGQIAGIVIGVLLGLIVIVLVILFIFKKRKTVPNAMAAVDGEKPSNYVATGPAGGVANEYVAEYDVSGENPSQYVTTGAEYDASGQAAFIYEDIPSNVFPIAKEEENAYEMA